MEKKEEEKKRHEPSYKQPEAKTNRSSFYGEIATDITPWNSERKDP